MSSGPTDGEGRPALCLHPWVMMTSVGRTPPAWLAGASCLGYTPAAALALSAPATLSLDEVTQPDPYGGEVETPTTGFASCSLGRRRAPCPRAHRAGRTLDRRCRPWAGVVCCPARSVSAAGAAVISLGREPQEDADVRGDSSKGATERHVRTILSPLAGLVDVRAGPSSGLRRWRVTAAPAALDEWRIQTSAVSAELGTGQPRKGLTCAAGSDILLSPHRQAQSATCGCPRP